MSKRTHHTNGFTIVEMVVVIVVLGILITITTISYLGIQTRTRVANAENSAKLLQKKVQAYFSISNKYPAASTATTDLNALTATKLDGVVTIGTPTQATGERTIKLQICTSGYTITYWDYTTNSLPGTPQISGGATVTSCANAT